MIKTLLLSSLFLAIVILWFACNPFDNLVRENSALLSLLGGLSVLAVFIQIYQADRQILLEANKTRAENRAHRVSRITALSSEIISNIQICNLYAREREEFIANHTASTVRFRYETAVDMICQGEIGHHQLRANLISIIDQLESINAIIFMNMLRVHLSPMLPSENAPLYYESLRSSLTKMYDLVANIRGQLANTQPQIEEFLSDPDKYLGERYLRERLIPDGLIP